MSNVALIDAITTNTNLCHVIGKGIALLFPNGAESDKRLLIFPTHVCEWVAVHIRVQTRKFRDLSIKQASYIYTCCYSRIY